MIGTTAALWEGLTSVNAVPMRGGARCATTPGLGKVRSGDPPTLHTPDNPLTSASSVCVSVTMEAVIPRASLLSASGNVFRQASKATGCLHRRRSFSVLHRPPPNYPGHVPLTFLERAGLAVGSGLMSLVDPRRAGEKINTLRDAARARLPRPVVREFDD